MESDQRLLISEVAEGDPVEPTTASSFPRYRTAYFPSWTIFASNSASSILCVVFPGSLQGSRVSFTVYKV